MVRENGGLVDPLEDYLYTKIRADDGKVKFFLLTLLLLCFLVRKFDVLEKN